MADEGELHASFAAAYDEFIQPIYRYFFYRLNDREQAKELAQETFMRAWDYARRGNRIEAMRPFLYRTAGNLFKNAIRDRKAVVSLDALMEESGFEVASKEVPLEELSEAKRLMHLVKQLSESDQQLLLLRYADGLPITQIAASLGKTETAVSVGIHRALKRLRVHYEGTL